MHKVLLSSYGVVYCRQDEGGNDAFVRPIALTEKGVSPPFRLISDLFNLIAKAKDTRKPAEKKRQYLESFFSVRSVSLMSMLALCSLTKSRNTVK